MKQLGLTLDFENGSVKSNTHTVRKMVDSSNVNPSPQDSIQLGSTVLESEIPVILENIDPDIADIKKYAPYITGCEGC